MANELNLKLDAQNAEAVNLPVTLQNSYREKLGKLLELTDDQKKRLKKWLKKRLDEWVEDTSDLHRMLEEDNDLVEGLVPETDFPWTGASNVHVDVTGIYMDVFQAIEKRSILGAETIWYAEANLENLQIGDQVADIENYLNDKARNDWNIAEMIPMAIWAKNRDGLCAVQITWEEEYENTRDILILSSEEEFLAEFPVPEEAGLSLEEWMQVRTYIIENATDETPVEIPITFEKRTYYGNKAEVVELIDFVVIPATAKTIYGPSCRGYGKRYRERKEIIRRKIQDKVYYEDAAKSLLKKGGQIDETSNWTMSRDYVEGLRRTNQKDEFENFELVVKGRLDGPDDEEGKYLVTYNHKNDLLLRAVEYPYRVDFYALFVLNKRPNRLIGKSIPSKTREMNDEIDTQHNQRINSRTISTVPTFIAQNDVKKEWDPKAPENKWRPGLIIYLSDVTKLNQFKVQPTDLGESMAEEKNDFSILDLWVGAPASLFSGQAPSVDPNAPGNKTALLINQGNMRMDDTLMEDRLGIAMMGTICLSHLYQFGPPILQYIDKTNPGQSEVRTLHKKLFRSGINLHMRGITVIQNPDAEMAKKVNLYNMLLTEPTFAQNDKARVELLRDALRAGREVGRDRYLPSPEELERQQIELQKKAIMEMEMQKRAAAEQAAQQELDARLKQAGQELKIRNTAKRLSEEGLSLAPVTNGAEVNAGGAG